MGMFDLVGHGGGIQEDLAYANQAKSPSPLGYKPRTFKETIQDQISAHKAKIDQLQAVLDSMSPEVEKFVEAMQKARL